MTKQTLLLQRRDDTGEDWYLIRRKNLPHEVLVQVCANVFRRHTGLKAGDLKKGETCEVTITVKIDKKVSL